jgi:hypothetical protein
MNAPRKYVVSKTLKAPTWRNTTIIRDNPIDAVRKLKTESGKRVFPRSHRCEIQVDVGPSVSDGRGGTELHQGIVRDSRLHVPQTIAT